MSFNICLDQVDYSQAKKKCFDTYFLAPQTYFLLIIKSFCWKQFMRNANQQRFKQRQLNYSHSSTLCTSCCENKVSEDCGQCFTSSLFSYAQSLRETFIFKSTDKSQRSSAKLHMKQHEMSVRMKIKCRVTTVIPVGLCTHCSPSCSSRSLHRSKSTCNIHQLFTHICNVTIILTKACCHC